MYQALYINRGDILKFGSARTGSRGYIAFSSYLDVPVVMGSRCTNLKSGIGGFKGRKLKDEDYINFRIKRRYLPYFLSRKLKPDDFLQESATLRVVMGPQDTMFDKKGIETFLSQEYTVTSDFDRMGCRLEGPFIAQKGSADMISEGIGGYPKIATVASVDIPKLVQRKTDHRVRFTAVSVQEAQKLYLEEERAYEKMRGAIHVPCKEVLDCRLVAKRVSRLFVG